MHPTLSVIICTHNPRRDYLDKVLTALKDQTLSKEKWELLLIDNASDHLLSQELDLDWHPQGRHIREEQLGLTPARVRGVREAIAETLVFVDDDNVLSEDYLETALNVSKQWSMLGAWGGQCIPEFETNPPEWTMPYWRLLAIRESDHNRWSNMLDWEATPLGAGGCYRRVVAERYSQTVSNDPRRKSMDRTGKSLSCGGDIDLAFTAIDMGLGVGTFKELKLTHLMASARLQEDYLLRLAEAGKYAELMLYYFRDIIPPKITWKQEIQLLFPWLPHPKSWLLNPRERKFDSAFRQGRLKAIKALSVYKK